MAKPKQPNSQEVDVDAQLRAMRDDDCDLAIFLGGRRVDELKYGRRDERLANMLEKSDQGGKQ